MPFGYAGAMSDPNLPPPIVPEPDLPTPVVPEPDLPDPVLPNPDLPEPPDTGSLRGDVETVFRLTYEMAVDGKTATFGPRLLAESADDAEFHALFREVYGAILAGRPPEFPHYASFADGHHEMLVGDAVAASAREGRWVDVAPLVDRGLRWRLHDGSSSKMVLDAQGHWVSTLGWTSRVEGPQPQLESCEEGRIAFDGQAGAKVALDTQDTTLVRLCLERYDLERRT